MTSPGHLGARAGLRAVAAVALLVGLTAAPAAVRATGAGGGGGEPTLAAGRPVPAVLPVVDRPGPRPGSVDVGVHLDWATESPAGYLARTGLRPAQYGVFAAFPLTAAGRQQVDTAVAAVEAVGGRLFLTVEPTGGLATVTPETADALAEALASYNARGVPALLRFGHEMNGSWYPWGQRPAAYREAFRVMALAVHRGAPGTAMVWSPNYGGGYPFAGGPHAALPGTADAVALDTDADGRLTMADDPYAPFYPGDEHVDWVGLTLYHWGSRWPWGSNDRPEPGKFVDSISGRYRGRAGDESALPDFYADYPVGHGKPMVLSETGALYHEGSAGTGASEGDIKGDWSSQVLDADLAGRFPLLTMVNWFEQRKHEGEIGGVVDWRVSADPTVRALFAAEVRARA